MTNHRPLTGASAIALALLFNAPYAVLAAIYEYPDILRRPAGEALTKFADGGALLILTWHVFALSALALTPLAVALSIRRDRLNRAPSLAIGAATFGALAGLAQAIGLWRWVFVVPLLARTYVDPAASLDARAAAEHSFTLLNHYGGVAIGEHLGQMLTAMFVTSLAILQRREGLHVTSALGALTAGCIVIGTTEGVAIALGQSGEAFALATIAGFLLLTAWLIATGVALMRGQQRSPTQEDQP